MIDLRSALRCCVLGVAAACVSGCGYSDEALDAAYREGHRAGIIWCKRQGAPAIPDLDAVLVERWQDGWRASTGLQCAAQAQGVLP